jgi:hypothetical protein
MSKFRVVSVAFITVLILFLGRESQAVIYKYLNEKGVPTFADDMQKIPEQYRAEAVIVTGGNDYDAYSEQEKARLAAVERSWPEQRSATPVKAEQPLSARLIRSGIAIGIFIALLFVVHHIDVLSEQAHLSRIRTVLVVLLVVFLGVTHARDVMGLFGNISDALPNPVASIQEKSAEQGKKAAEAYKSMDRVLNQQMQGEEARLRETERTVDDPERGK